MKQLFFCSIALIGFIGCQNDYEDFGSIIESKSYSISELEAIASAKAFISSFYTRSGGTKEVGDVYAWLTSDYVPATRSSEVISNESDTLFYIVNFKNDDGFVLVHSQDHIGGILAYVEKGNLCPSDSIESDGFRYYLDCLQSVLPDPIEPLPRDTAIGGPDPAYPEPSVFDLPWVIDSIIPPLLTTQWGQLAPFNTYCFTANGQQAVAGCVPVSIAQISAFYAYPSGYNAHLYDWEEIMASSVPTSVAGRESVAHLVHDIGIIAHTSYGVSSSSTSPSRKGSTLDSLGYHYSYAAYDYDLCMQEFEAGRPVLFGGYQYVPGMMFVGHSWVVDGGLVRSKYVALTDMGGVTYQQRVAMQKLIHCNWGADGRYDGYFLFDNLELQNRVLDNDLEIPTGMVSNNYNFNIHSNTPPIFLLFLYY